MFAVSNNPRQNSYDLQAVVSYTATTPSTTTGISRTITTTRICEEKGMQLWEKEEHNKTI